MKTAKSSLDLTEYDTIMLMEDIKKELAIQPVKKRIGYNHLKRKYSTRRKQELAKKAIVITAKGGTLTELAIKEDLPLSTLSMIISSDALFEAYKKRKAQFIQTKMLESANKDLERQGKLRKQASHGQLTASIGMKWDKLFPIPGNLQQFNIGDVKMPRYFRPRSYKQK